MIPPSRLLPLKSGRGGELLRGLSVQLKSEVVNRVLTLLLCFLQRFQTASSGNGGNYNNLSCDSRYVHIADYCSVGGRFRSIDGNKK